MISEPLLQKTQATHPELNSLLTKKLRIKSLLRHELNLNQEPFHRQIIKKEKASTWRFDSEANWINHNLSLKSLIRAMKSNKNMQRLEFKFKRDPRISNQDFYYMAQSLKNLSCLKNLSLPFEYVDIAERGFSQLCKGLNSIVCPQKFRLLLRARNSITDQTLYDLSRSIKKLFLIQELDLSFYSCRQITNIGLRKISQCLKSCSHLKILNLSFPFCDRITDEGLYEISKGLKNLLCLESLSLIIYLRDITDSGIQSISESFKGLTQIKSIELGFWSCPRITDASLLALGEDLKGLRTLRNLEMDFKQCYQITDKGVDGLTRNLKELEDLQRVWFNFSVNSQISDLGLEHLVQNLKGSGNLKEVMFDFRTCPRVSISGKNKILKVLRYHASRSKIDVKIDERTKMKKKRSYIGPLMFALVGVLLSWFLFDVLPDLLKNETNKILTRF